MTAEQLNAALPRWGAMLFPLVAFGLSLCSKADEYDKQGLDSLAVACGISGIITAAGGVIVHMLLIFALINFLAG